MDIWKCGNWTESHKEGKRKTLVLKRRSENDLMDVSFPMQLSGSSWNNLRLLLANPDLSCDL